MTLDEFKKLLCPDGQVEPVYSNMVGTDHLILSSHVTTPHLKAVCKKAFSQNFDITLLNTDELLEYQLSFFIMGLMSFSKFKDQLDFIYNNSYRAKSWMTTDICNQYYKKMSFDEFVPYFNKLKKMKGVYQRRFAYVIALKFVKDENNSSFLIKNIVKSDEYYVYMAESWLLAEIAVYHYELVKDFLISSDALIVLKKKTISKILDSFRIDDDKKEEIKIIRKSLKI